MRWWVAEAETRVGSQGARARRAEILGMRTSTFHLVSIFVPSPWHGDYDV